MCLAWNTPGLQKIFEGQESWDHNFCRNPGGLEEGPICYIDEHNVDLCQVQHLAKHYTFSLEKIDRVKCLHGRDLLENDCAVKNIRQWKMRKPCRILEVKTSLHMRKHL